MKIETAIRHLRQEHKKALASVHIYDPTAYALYQVWKEAEAERQKKERKAENEDNA